MPPTHPDEYDLVAGDTLVIGRDQNIELVVLGVRPTKVRFGVSAPPGMRVARYELTDEGQHRPEQPAAPAAFSDAAGEDAERPAPEELTLTEILAAIERRLQLLRAEQARLEAVVTELRRQHPA